MEPLVPPQVNIILQIVILAILLASLGFKLKKRYWQHGALMLAALMLNLFSFVLVMLPSLLRIEIIRTQPFHTVSVAVLSHAALGAVTILLSVWLVAAWHLQSGSGDCFRRKLLMRITIVLWTLSIALGFLVYAYLYTTLIP